MIYKVYYLSVANIFINNHFLLIFCVHFLFIFGQVVFLFFLLINI